MKKLLFALVVVSMTAFTTLKADDDGLKVGAGAGYGLDIEELAIQVGGIYSSDLPVDIAADFKYYLLEDPLSAWELNANALYYITDNKGTNFYLLGGLSYATVTASFDLGPFGGETSTSSSEVGINLGAGANIGLGGATLMPQVKFTIGALEQLFIGAFVMFPI